MSNLNLYGLFPTNAQEEESYKQTNNKLFGERVGEPIKCTHISLDIDGEYQFIKGSEFGEFKGDNGIVLTEVIENLELKESADLRRKFTKFKKQLGV